MAAALEELLAIVREAVGRHPSCRRRRSHCRWCDMREALERVDREGPCK